MAQQNRCESSLDARLRRRQELEDTPMTRQGTAVDTTAAAQSCTTRQLGTLITLMEEQNRLLYDILGAMTSLTAAQLAASQVHHD